MQEIGLQDLIEQVKRELLATNQAQRARDPYPLFVIDKIELELTVNVSYGADGGLKLTVPTLAELSVGGSAAQDRGHVVKISLTPLLPQAEIAAEVLQDPRVRNIVQHDLRRALLKGDDDRAGEPE